ncbi:MAG TPA: chemotaxis protein CheX [Armatimonadota bacterium]|nr:chemotaxis protein CheX [Armatimonadota bacterium]
MKVEFVNPFLQAGSDVLIQFVGGSAEYGQLAVRSAIFTSQELSIVVGVSGKIKGQVIYGMSTVTASKIAAAMMGTEVVTFDEMAMSAISELGNIISGNAMTLLSDAGFTCDITPPTIVRGLAVQIATHTPALVVPLITACGNLDINVALQETEG